MKIVFISGWGADEKVWSPITKNIDYHIIHIPWWECLGDSMNNNSLLSFLSDTETPVILVGWSLGGMIAIHSSTVFPSKVSGLVVISSTARMLQDKDYKGVNKRVLKAMKSKLLSNSVVLLNDFAIMADLPSNNEIVQNNFIETAKTIDNDKLYKGLEYLEKTDIRINLSNIKIPVFIFAGDSDKIIEPLNSEYIKNNIDNSKVKILPDTGHFLIFYKPELIVESIKKLIDYVAQASSL